MQLAEKEDVFSDISEYGAFGIGRCLEKRLKKGKLGLNWGSGGTEYKTKVS